MQKLLNNLAKIKCKSLLFILLSTIMAEVFLFNISYWKTLGCEPLILCTDGITDENGYFSTEQTPINGPIKNVSVSLAELSATDKAAVTVYITDAGNAYEYPTPEYTVVPGIDKSGYTNIYPYGDVSSIRVTL